MPSAPWVPLGILVFVLPILRGSFLTDVSFVFSSSCQLLLLMGSTCQAFSPHACRKTGPVEPLL